jgi:deoxyribonuclease-4
MTIKGIIIGAHINSNLDYLIKDATRIHNNGGNIVQLFVNITSNKTKIQYDDFKNFLKSKNMICVVHISYTINCSQNWGYHSWWIKQFIMEIEYAEKIGALYVIVHLGKQLELSYEEALNNMYTSLLYVHKQTANNIKILLETSTGQGSEICFELEKLAHFYKKISKHNNNEIRDRFGICLDTCHIFASGYDISTNDGVKKYFDLFESLIGIEHIKLIHLNDSKKECGSRVDRHSNIGNGFIGQNTLILIKNMFIRLEVPIILETPIDGQDKDLKIISVI